MPLDRCPSCYGKFKNVVQHWNYSPHCSPLLEYETKQSFRLKKKRRKKKKMKKKEEEEEEEKLKKRKIGGVCEESSERQDGFDCGVGVDGGCIGLDASGDVKSRYSEGMSLGYVDVPVLERVQHSYPLRGRRLLSSSLELSGNGTEDSKPLSRQLLSSRGSSLFSSSSQVVGGDSISRIGVGMSMSVDGVSDIAECGKSSVMLSSMSVGSDKTLVSDQYCGFIPPSTTRCDMSSSLPIAIQVHNNVSNKNNNGNIINENNNKNNTNNNNNINEKNNNNNSTISNTNTNNDNDNNNNNDDSNNNNINIYNNNIYNNNNNNNNNNGNNGNNDNGIYLHMATFCSKYSAQCRELVVSDCDRSMASIYQIFDQVGAPRYLCDDVMEQIRFEVANNHFDLFDPLLVKRDAFFKRIQTSVGGVSPCDVPLTLDSGLRVSCVTFDFVGQLKKHLLSKVFGVLEHLDVDPDDPWSTGYVGMHYNNKNNNDNNNTNNNNDDNDNSEDNNNNINNNINNNKNNNENDNNNNDDNNNNNNNNNNNDNCKQQ